jgi:uncharacterized protein YdeI (YjbR/CyaY-like superfamily)
MPGDQSALPRAALDSAARIELREPMTAKKRPAKAKKSKAEPSEAAATKTARVKRAVVNPVSAELPIASFRSSAEFAKWLAAHHGSSRGIWLRLMKKASGVPSVTHQEALGNALAYGWIDGQIKVCDEQSWLRKFVPRGARSTWSKINRDKALALMKSGQMQPAGLEQVERAKRDGRWKAAYDSQSKAEVPPDLAAALGKSPRAAAFFETLEARNRYAVLFRVHTSKQPETRERKIRELVAMLERREKIHP